MKIMAYYNMKSWLYSICILGLAGLSINIHAESSVWEVSKGEAKVYLAGSCHVLRAEDFPLPEEFELAYGQSNHLVFETDIEMMQNPAFAAQLMQMSTYEGGKTLQTELSEKTYEALKAASGKVGLPIAIVERFKPGMALMMVTIQTLVKLGFSQEGVDAYFHSLAKKDGKVISSLETPLFQAELIANMGMNQPDDFILYSLDEIDEVETQFPPLVAAWKSGDSGNLVDFFIDDIKKYPDVYDPFLRDRNIDWLPKVEVFLETPDTEMVVVGVAHIVGPDGLIELLDAKGYDVKQLKAK